MAGKQDDATISHAYREHRPYLVDLAFRMLGDLGAAEDVVQDAFARLLRARTGEIDDERGWLVVATSRLALDQITTIRMPDSKGLRDIAALLTQPREQVRATQLAGLVAPGGADPVLDDRARAAYKARLTELDQDIDDASAGNDLERAARAVAERDVLISELTHAVGLGGRSRRLGDDSERARKAVTARIHHAIDRIQHYHPDLAAHLRAAIRTGTACTYQPAQPVDWTL